MEEDTGCIDDSCKHTTQKEENINVKKFRLKIL